MPTAKGNLKCVGISRLVCERACLSLDLLTAAEGKNIPTKKLEVQLEQPATATAAGRGPWLKSSATINQGMGPGPISKKAT